MKVILNREWHPQHRGDNHSRDGGSYLLNLGRSEIIFGEEIDKDTDIADETESDRVEVELSSSSFNGTP